MKHKKCPTCKKRFYKKRNYSRKYWERQRYCSLICSKTWFERGTKPKGRGNRGKRGSENANYRGGRIINKVGYVLVLLVGTNHYQYEHRKVMENFLGRKLKRNESIHHINGIRSDNNLENLLLMKKREHDRFSTTERWRRKKCLITD
jgi:hypothetical protein